MRRRYHCTSASNWDSKAWKFSHTERKSYVCALRYVPAKFYYSNSRPHKCRTCNYVSTSAENGPAMAGPTGPVPAPMNDYFLYLYGGFEVRAKSQASYNLSSKHMGLIRVCMQAYKLPAHFVWATLGSLKNSP